MLCPMMPLFVEYYGGTWWDRVLLRIRGWVRVRCPACHGDVEVGLASAEPICRIVCQRCYGAGRILVVEIDGER